MPCFQLLCKTSLTLAAGSCWGLLWEWFCNGFTDLSKSDDECFQIQPTSLPESIICFITSLLSLENCLVTSSFFFVCDKPPNLWSNRYVLEVWSDFQGCSDSKLPFPNFYCSIFLLFLQCHKPSKIQRSTFCFYTSAFCLLFHFVSLLSLKPL